MTKEIIIQIIGVTGGVLFFVKLSLHIYLIRITDKKYSFKNFGAFTDPMLFLPVMDKVEPKHKIVKTLANVCYSVFVICMAACIISTNVSLLRFSNF